MIKFHCKCLVLLLLLALAKLPRLVLGGSGNPKAYHIGAIFNSMDNVNYFNRVIADIDYDGQSVPSGVHIYGHPMLKQSNGIDDVLQFCTKLMPNKISSLIIDDRIPSEAIAFTTSLHNIPTIGLTNRESIFSDKSLYGSYMRTSSTYSHQADVWVELLSHLNYECVHFLVSDSTNGRKMKNRFILLARKRNMNIETVLEYSHRHAHIAPQLKEIHDRNSSCRVFVLYSDQQQAPKLLHQIVAQNMTSQGSVWIVSEQVLTAPNLPMGFLGTRYKDWLNVDAHIYDSVNLILSAIKSMHYQVNFTTPPTDCKNIGRAKWLEGSIFYDYLREQKVLFGKTGKISFDSRGDRLYGDYEILNKKYDRKYNRLETVMATVGEYAYNRTVLKMEMSFRESSVLWPGNQSSKPQGYLVPNHLRIATIEEKPFVWVKETDRDGNCQHGQVLCPLQKVNNLTGIAYQELHCCFGYCMDLLNAVAAQLNFTYTLYQVADGTYGTYSHNRETDKMEWSGLLGEIFYGRADMVVAALTITPERSVAIDFTKPFKYQGMTILQKRQSGHRLRHPLTSFLQPFQNSLWVSVFVAVHIVALTLYLLDRFSPFGRYKLPSCETITEEDALNLSSAIWFAWGVLFNSGIGEGTPRSFAGRVLGMVWAGFAMIVVASYTANLAAFLVLDRPETALTGINDPRLRYPLEGFNYSTVRGSSVEMYFRRQVELAPMYKRMADIRFNSSEEAIQAVKDGSLNALIWDSSRLEYEAAQDCELSISGELFGRSGYAIGLPKGHAYWKDKVSLALLGMHEVGYMEDLDNKWILLNEQICEEKNTANFPPTLGLKNMAGVFMLVGTGILGGVGLIMFEIFYKRHQNMKMKRSELARNAVDKWKEMVENRKILMESLNMSTRQRYKERHQIHRKRQQMRNNLRSEDKSISFSSIGSGETASGSATGASNVLVRRGNFASMGESSINSSNETTNRIAKPPVSLDLKLAHSPIRSGPSSNYHRTDIEQHPRANTRIMQTSSLSKPPLCRGYSVNDDYDASFLPPPPPPVAPGTSSQYHEYSHEPSCSRQSSFPLPPPGGYDDDDHREGGEEVYYSSRNHQRPQQIPTPPPPPSIQRYLDQQVQQHQQAQHQQQRYRPYGMSSVPGSLMATPTSSVPFPPPPPHSKSTGFNNNNPGTAGGYNA